MKTLLLLAITASSMLANTIYTISGNFGRSSDGSFAAVDNQNFSASFQAEPVNCNPAPDGGCNLHITDASLTLGSSTFSGMPLGGSAVVPGFLFGFPELQFGSLGVLVELFTTTPLLDSTKQLSAGNLGLDHARFAAFVSPGVSYIYNPTGTLSAVQGVPEPGAGYLILAGLGVLGAVRMRRKA